jgi:hypothetical protein
MNLLDQLSPEARQEIEKLLASTGADGVEKSILIDGESRRKLETLFGKNLNSAADLIRNVEHALEFEIDSTPIALTPYLLDRLKTRAIGMSFDRFLPWIIKRQLEEYVGLR